MNHTPTPWKVAGEHGSYLASVEGGFVPLRTPFRADAFDGANRSDHPEEELKANAEFIVTAVNSYQAMKEALEEIVQWNDVSLIEDEWPLVISQVKQALTLANGGQP